MTSNSSSIQSAVAMEKLLQTNIISVTLKFGFQQKSFKYVINEGSGSIVERIHLDAENWLRTVASNNNRTYPIADRYTLYLFRIPANDLTMVPIAQLSDIEQNCLIELVVVPVEINQNPHALYRFQVSTSINCSKCSRLILGNSRQAFRCRTCRMTYHKDCAPFLLEDCSAPTDPPQSTIKSSEPIFVSPIVSAPIGSSIPTGDSVNNNTIVPIYSISTHSSRSTEQENQAVGVVINDGIFPACLRGSLIYRRYLFLLTSTTLKLTSNLLSDQRQQQKRSPADIETVLQLAEIVDLILTHFIEDRDHIFEIHFQGDFVLCVGKKSDPDDLQMQTAQFYSSIRDQWEALLNTSTTTQPSSPTPSTINKMGESSLIRRKSVYRRPPCGSDNEDQDLHEIYAFTGEKIGEGQFGRVVGAVRKSTNKKVAIKCIEKARCSEDDIRRTNEEITHLQKFNHLNILKLEAYFERGDAVYIVTERMQTDMCKYIMDSPNRYLDEKMCKMLIYQVMIALRYLHSNNCGHLDVKCENILISFLQPIPNSNNRPNQTSRFRGELPLAKLADFGYSRIIGEHSFRKTRVGTKLYCAPEIYRSKEGYNRLVDMWSVGIVTYAALSGTLPYDEKDVHRAEEIVRNKNLMYSHRRWRDVSPEAIDLISNKFLVVQPISRIRATEALFHAWFTDFHLYRSLREIEKRIEYEFFSKQQEIPSPSNWLTIEREDQVWSEFKSMYEKSAES